MKSILMLILILVVLPSAIASSGDFSMTEIFEDEVKNGNNSFGNLLFVENNYISDIHLQSSIDDKTYQQYDTLRWLGNSIKIREPSFGVQTVLVSGSEYYFEKSGTYTITSMQNNTNIASLTINPADDIDIKIDDIVVPTGFTLDFSNYEFKVVDEENLVVYLDVDDDVASGHYDLSYNVNGVKNDFSVSVLEIINWTINQDNLTITPTIKAGSGLYIGRVLIENIGNQDVEITTIKSGNLTSMIGIPQPQTLYRKNILQLDFQVQVPSVTPAGIYYIKIGFTDGDVLKEVDLNISVIDTTSPIIEEIDFSSDNVFVKNEIRVIATDNDNVVNLTMEFDGKTLGFLKDGNQFTRTVEFNKLSRYIIKFCAYDKEGNDMCEIINKTFSRVKVLEGNQRVLNMDSMRYGRYSNIYLFNITKNLEQPIVLTLVDVDIFPNNGSVVYRVVDNMGVIKTFGKYNSEVIIDEVGEYFFEIRANTILEVSGVIGVDVPEQYEQIQDSSFKVSFKDYDVPKDFSLAWVGGRDIICSVTDTGNLDTSYYDCNLKYPIDTRVEDISVPTTISERNKFEGEANKVRDELSESKVTFGVVVGILVGMMFLIILYTIFMIRWYPYVRIQTGKSSDERKL